ncbi:MAG: hypothetical protein ACYC0H_13640 [Solirubrobacteraceae bacterium]
MTTRSQYYRGATGEITVSVREARLVVERFLSVVGVPMGAVVPIRDVVIDAETLGLGALGHLAHRVDERVALNPVQWSITDGDIVSVDGTGRSALLIAPDLVDLAVARAHRTGRAILDAHGVAEPRLLAALTASAHLYGVDLSVRLPTDEEWVSRGHAGEPEARRTPAGALHLDTDSARIECVVAAKPAIVSRNTPIESAALRRTLRDGFRVDAELWWSLWDRANHALAPDSALSRSHAGASVYDDSGQLLGELGEEWDDGYLGASVPVGDSSLHRSTLPRERLS